MDTIMPSAATVWEPLIPPWSELRPFDHLARCASRVATLQAECRPTRDPDGELVDARCQGRLIEIPRRQMAILAGDVAGYSRLIENDDLGTVARLLFLRRELLDPTAILFHAAVIRHTADAILLAFESPLDAMGCALTLQSVLFLLNEEVPQGRSIRMRMGLSVGQVLLVDHDIHGTGVNIAARLEALAGAGEIYLCERAAGYVQHVLPLEFEPVGERRLHNISLPVRIFRVALDEIARIARQHAQPAANDLALC